MRALISASVLAAVVSAAGCSSAGVGSNQAAAESLSEDQATLGNLIQVMRGSLFRDANIVFDVQQIDPGSRGTGRLQEDGRRTPRCGERHSRGSRGKESRQGD